MAATKLLSDNGVTSGITGYQLTGGNDGTLQLQTTTSGGTATTAMTIDTSQNVGVGTTSPAYKLDLSGAIKIGTGTDGGSGNLFLDNGSTFAQYGYRLGWFTGANSARTERMRLDENGNVGIGTSSPTGISGYTALKINNATNGAILDLAQGDAYKGRLVATGTSFAVETSGTIPIIFSTGGSEDARIDSSGHFVQAAGCRIYSIGTYNLTTAAAANLNVDGNGTFFRSTSALKYKKDIRDLESIDVNLFRAVRYKSKSESDDQTKDHFGIVADEVHAAGITELVNYGVDGEVEGFQYERLTVVLLKHCQEQQSLINNLTERLAALEAK